MNHDALIEQLRVWAETLEHEAQAPVDGVVVHRVVAGLRQVADDLERDQEPG